MPDLPFQYEYPRPAVSVDLIIVREAASGSWEIMLIERGREPFKGCWALPGGFLDEDETLEECAARELKEETGVEIASDQLVQFKAYSQLDRDPRTRVISVAFSAFVTTEVIPVAADDAADVKWFQVLGLPSLAFDHASIVADWLASREK